MQLIVLVLILNCQAFVYTHKHTQSQPSANHMRWSTHASAYRDTRQLRGTTWLPKDPEAHVNSSLHPTSGLCILTKHLAVSAPVHHSRDPTHPPPPFCLCVCLCTLGGPYRENWIAHSDSWRFSVHKWASCMHIHVDLIIRQRLKLLALTA